MLRRFRTVAVGIALLWRLAAAQGQSPMPELPSDVPKDAEMRTCIGAKTPTGQDAVWKDADGTIHEFFQFNDRGRGPKTYSTYRLNSDGIITAEQTNGVDYMKKAVAEEYTLRDGKAEWKNQSEDEKAANREGKFYVDLNAGPESGAILARALLRKGGRLAVLPSGEARIRQLQTVAIEGEGKKVKATLYEVTGLSFTPSYLWLDDARRFLAVTSPWFAIIRQGFEPSIETLRSAPSSQNQESHTLAMALGITLVSLVND